MMQKTPLISTSLHVETLWDVRFMSVHYGTELFFRLTHRILQLKYFCLNMLKSITEE